MRKQVWITGVLFCVLWVLGLAASGEALFIDKARTLEVSGKVQTRVTFRLQDAEGYTYPHTTVGDMVQFRNLALIEVEHDLKKLTDELDILYPFRALGIGVKYHILGRFLYEAIYDIGPEIFQDVKEMDEKNIDEFKQSYDLWEFYADFFKGPMFVRVGRQILAWGETDVFRLLDGINPLDNTFGGFFEDLDDRRIPLWMLRASLNLGDAGPLHTLTLEGFLVPGPVDAHVSPWAPYGTPYASPIPSLLVPSLRIMPADREWRNSRWGVRMQGLIGSNLNVSVAHYQTILDMPSLRSVIVGSPPILVDLNDLQLWAEYHDVRITGGSFNYWESLTDTVFRGEVAWFWDEPVFIPEINNSTFFGDQLALPPPVLDLVKDALGVDIRDLGLYGLPLNPKSGSVPTKNILRFMIGFDKNFWIRPLNKKSTFFASFQYFGTWVPNYDDRMRQGALIYPSLKDYPKVKELEHIFTLLVSSTYMKGNLLPQVSLAYDVRGSAMFQPAVTYIWEPFRFMVQYTDIFGAWTSLGFFRDRDQISFVVSYLLN